MSKAKAPTREIMIMNTKDNVAVCLRNFEKGETVFVAASGDAQKIDPKIDPKIKLIDPIPLGHKIALADIGTGDSVIKYGEIIGKATSDIAVGQHVHVHNLTDDQ
jgi:altronate dehydratase small subunit